MGLNVNVGKSEIVPVGEVNNLDALANILHCSGQFAYEIFGDAVGIFF